MMSSKFQFVVQNLMSRTRRSNLKSAPVVFLGFAMAFFISFTVQAQSDDVSRLKDNIATLKSKIRTSNAKDPKDIQRLYKLENELEKKQYLRKNTRGR